MREEEPKRLEPTKPTLRRLYVLSGNLCAFPDCNKALLNKHNDFIGQICHIEGVGRRGERFNQNMTNEQRRAPENLLILCHEHHIRTDDVETYTVDEMRRMKAAHESKFGDPDLIAQRMFDKFTDQSKSYSPEQPKNLGKIFPPQFRFTDDEKREMIEHFNQTMDDFSELTPSSKSLFSIALERSSKSSGLSSYPSVPSNCTYFYIEEVQNAVGGAASTIFHSIIEMERYELITDHETQRGTVYIFCGKGSDWDLWGDLKDCCAKYEISLHDLLRTGDFSRLDL